MNLKPPRKSLFKPLLFTLAVVVLTALFVPAQIMGQSSFIYLWFLMLLVLYLLSLKKPAINSIVLKTLFFSMVLYLSLKYGAFFVNAKDTQLIGLFSAMLLPVIFFYPRLMTYMNLSLILFFSSSSFGIKAYKGMVAFIGGTFTRGDARYGISYANIFLIFTLMAILFLEIIRKKEKDGNVSCNLYKYLWIFNGAFLIYMVWGVMLGVDMKDIVKDTGVIHITNMSILIFIMHRMFKNENYFEKLKTFFLSCMMARGFFSVFRFIFGSGDPQNAYANLLGIESVKISLFDIGDGLIQCVALFYALYMLLNKSERVLSVKATRFYWLIAFVGLFNILFSYRRTGWFGLLLAFIWLLHNLQLKQKIAAMLVAVTLGFTVFAGIIASRFDESEGMFSDIVSEEGDVSLKEGRFIELYVAWLTIKENILVGVGPWGKYKVLGDEDKWGFRSDLTHSSFVHIFLKMGIIGLFIYISIFYAYISFWLKKRKEMPVHVRGFAEACFAGFLFFIPNILWGSPIVSYRIMLLLGFVMAIPYITYHIYKVQNTRKDIDESLVPS